MTLINNKQWLYEFNTLMKAFLFEFPELEKTSDRELVINIRNKQRRDKRLLKNDAMNHISPVNYDCIPSEYSEDDMLEVITYLRKDREETTYGDLKPGRKRIKQLPISIRIKDHALEGRKGIILSQRPQDGKYLVEVDYRGAKVQGYFTYNEIGQRNDKY